jgi:hypothetical protein
MPVLVEFQTLLVRREALEAAPSGARARAVANAVHLLDDGALVGFAFDRPAGRGAALAALEEAGLGLDAGAGSEEPGEVALVGQRSGPFGWWPWLELGLLPAPGGERVLAARRAGDPRRELVLPEGWSHEGSATRRAGLCALGLPDRPLCHLQREDGADLYLDRFTGEEVRLARSRPPVALAIATRAGASHHLVVEVAERWPEIEVGLMFREGIPTDGGMLFRFGEVREHGFWMKNTRVPLDLLFLDEGGWVARVAERATPLTTTRVRSGGPVAAVLEVAGGWCAAHGVAAGDRVQVEPGSRPGGVP